MDVDVDHLETAIRLLAAAACGAVLGWEREISDKPAGLRTNMLVALGASAVSLVTLQFFADVTSKELNFGTADPVRIISGVIGGLGFLGAGAIIQSRGNVRGMTTAATIWVVGGIGVACGLGYYVIAAMTCAIAFIVLWGIARLEYSKVVPSNIRKPKPPNTDEPATPTQPESDQ